MTARVQKLLLLLLLLCLTLGFLLQAVEARSWHNLKALRKHQITQEADNHDLDASSVDKELVRHRRYYPAANGDSGEKLLSEVKDAESYEEVQEEMERLPHLPRLHRPLGHRRPRLQTKHLHHRSLKRHHERDHESSNYLNADPLDLVREQDNQDDQEYLDASRARGKRHYHRKTWTEKDKKAFNESRLKLVQLENDKTYEVEVKEAQNSSLCNYTVIPIPDPGDRVPSVLEHVKCNHVGSRCQDVGAYCCIQTYRNIQVMYESTRTKELLKVYSGCVCSLQIYGTLEPYIPDLDLDE